MEAVFGIKESLKFYNSFESIFSGMVEIANRTTIRSALLKFSVRGRIFVINWIAIRTKYGTRAVMRKMNVSLYCLKG